MRRPNLSLLLAILSLVAAPALAGCIGSAQATSAKEHMSAADAAAKAWAEDAALAQIVGVEGALGVLTAALGGGSSRDFSQASEDEKVGDGKAEVWVYRYLSASKPESFAVVLDKEGAVLRSGEEARDPREIPLGAWSMDSDAALAAALGANDGLRKGIEGRYFGLVAMLTQKGVGNAVWIVTGGGGDLMGGGGGKVVLDAVTGKILSSEGGFQSA